ncbi:MAG: hypothetical protein ACK45H_06990 [Bacteroidota bacterium]
MLRYFDMRLTVFLLLILIGFNSRAQCDSVNATNQQIINLVSAKIGKKVLRGECWDLAKYALDEVGADWDGLYEFGRLLAPNECIMPGDIIQFKNVKLKYKRGTSTYTEIMTHHTAIIYEVKSADEIVLLHQNTAVYGKKVAPSPMKFSTIIKGTYKIYRPTKN